MTGPLALALDTNARKTALAHLGAQMYERKAARVPRRVAAMRSRPPLQNLKTPPKGYLCMNPRVLPPFFRPQSTPCGPEATTYVDSPVGRAPGFNPAPLLDIANDGTFSGARRAATLGHQNPDDVGRAINALAGAAMDGRVPGSVAADRIAQLADVPLAAAQAAQRVRALTPDELAARRRRAAGGLSDTTLEAARDARLQEACEPTFCYIEKDGLGREVALNYGKGRTRAEIMADKAFSRFCSEEEIARTQGVAADQSWGDWFIIKARQAFGGEAGEHRETFSPVQPAPTGPRVSAGPAVGSGTPPTPAPDGKKYLCLDPRVLPPFFRVYPGPCTAPLIPYPGQD